MKHSRLSSFCRQLIIFGLLVTLLWFESRPAIGPDGLMLVEMADVFFGFPAPGSLSHHDLISIVESKIEFDTGFTRTSYLLNDIPLASATWHEPKKTFGELCQKAPFLRRLVPKRWKWDGGWLLEVKLTPNQYDLLQSARQRDSRLSLTKAMVQQNKIQ